MASSSSPAAPRVLHPQDAAEVAEYVQSRGFRRVALQVPDGRLLRDAPLLAAEVRVALAERRRRQRRAANQQQENEQEEDEDLFILADTSANPLAVDEVAAAHHAGPGGCCVVHFGPASLTPTSGTPALCVLPRRRLPRAPAADVDAGDEEEWGKEQDDKDNDEEEEGEKEEARRAAAMGRLIARQLREEAAAEEEEGGGGRLRAAVVLLDQGYVHALPRVERAALEALRLPRPGGEGDGEDRGSGDAPPKPPLVPWPVAFARPLPRVLDPGGGSSECLSLRRRPEEVEKARQEEQAAGTTAATTAATAATTAPPPLLLQTGAGLQWSNPGGASRSETLLLWIGPLVEGGGAGGGGGGGAEGSGDADDEEDERQEAAAFAAAGPAAAPLARLQLVYSDAPWRAVDPRAASTVERGPSRTCQMLRRRRRFAVSAAHGSAMVGVLVGTLGAAGFREAVEAVRALALAAGKRPYTLLVGKPNPAKLANFPELGCFVHVTDPEGALLLAAQAAGGGGGGGGGDFLAPVVTPHEAAVAFGAAARGLDAHDAVAMLESRPYSLGFDTVVREAAEVLSLSSGGRRAAGGEGDEGEEEEEEQEANGAALVAASGGSGALAPVQAAGDILARAERAPGGAAAIQPATAAEFLLLRRGYRGLEAPAATGAASKAAALATEGRLGRAAGYCDEGGGGGEGGY
jgi:diphthamide biosynthesis protein 2